MRSHAQFFLVASIVQSMLMGLVLAAWSVLMSRASDALGFLPIVISMVLGALIPMLLFNLVFLMIIARWFRKTDDRPGSLAVVGLAYGGVYFLLLSTMQLTFGSPLGTWAGAGTSDMIIIYCVTCLGCGLVAGEAADRFIAR